MPIYIRSDQTDSLPADEAISSSYAYTICGVAALGGILFGFDMVIISGTVTFFTDYFHLDAAGTGWSVGCINLGAALGALSAGKIADTIGRKRTMLGCAFLFALTGFATGWAPGFSLFITARMLSGVAVGAAAMVCPMYIAEAAPAAIRGRLVTFYQLAIVTGLLMAYFSNYLLLNTGPDNWRWMFSSQTVPAIFFLACLFFIPESPRWLIAKGKSETAAKVLFKIGGKNYALAEAVAIQNSFLNYPNSSLRDVFGKDVIKIVLVGTVVAIFSQAVGENSLFSYAPVIFQEAGIGTEAAFQQSIIIGTINFAFTFVAIFFIERLGRRRLLLYGSILAALDASLLAASFYFHADGVIVLISVLVFIAIYASSLGPVTWVLLSEIFPNRIRANAMSVATLSLWIANFLTTASFPISKSYLGLHLTFALHAAICLIYFFWIRKNIPETKGKSLEEIEMKLVGRRHGKSL